jgi:hypothetical protein
LRQNVAILGIHRHVVVGLFRGEGWLSLAPG